LDKGGPSIDLLCQSGIMKLFGFPLNINNDETINFLNLYSNYQERLSGFDKTEQPFKVLGFLLSNLIYGKLPHKLYP